jgi:membrane-associated phospholipid phosphatase
MQPVVTIPVLALCRPRHGNAIFLTSMLVAMLLTLLIATFTPAIGPGFALGLEPLAGPVIQALRAAPGAQNLPYAGIVSFPSFHAVMAVLLIYSHRGLHWTFPAVLVINILMLISIPYCGDHYLIDVAGGLIVSICTIGVLRLMAPAFSQAVLTEPQSRRDRRPPVFGLGVGPRSISAQCVPDTPHASASERKTPALLSTHPLR